MPDNINNKMEIIKDKLYGRLNIRTNDGNKINDYIFDLEINDLVDTQPEPAGWHEENGESYFRTLEK